MKTHGINRRKFFGALIGLGLGSAAYGYSEAVRIRVSRCQIPLGDSRPLKLLHLSDLHLSPMLPLDFIRIAIDLGLAEQPDLICLTGDYITYSLEQGEAYSALLSRLSNSAPTFASLGNHDGGNWSRHHRGYRTSELICRTLRNAGIQVLKNVGATITLRGRTLRLIGVGDIWAREFNPVKAFSSVPDTGAPTILLSHNPDTKDLVAQYTWNLMLSGHTHGGEVSLPLIGEPFAPVKDKRFIAGLYPWNNRWIHITRGIGSVLHMRFNCRPEVSLLTLV
jgi:predicted MPP superfamily phosphohydrolase